MPSDAATCRNLVKVYRTATGEVHALKGVDATFLTGKVSAIVGPSGSGKSTMLRILAGIDQPTAGSVRVADRELEHVSRFARHGFRRKHVGYVFQRPVDNLVPHLDAITHVRDAATDEGPDPEGLLEQLGLAHRLDHRPDELSGGEQQRLAFAQAVARAPTVVIADEPTAELDRTAAHMLLECVHALAGEGLAFVLATHDPQVVDAADHVLELRHGAVLSERSGADVYSVIDEAGRVQLPEEALDWFPDRRAVLHLEDGEIRMSPP
ncbi:MAG: ATP-binding cassette domain-containing protein [Nitriliruptorales bacterium]|nr:ATP-binding cassette domain-containing protein [Nitriliruptorales bacterium]